MALMPHVQETDSEVQLNINSIVRQWHPTPVLLPGKSHGWRSLVGCNPIHGVAESRTRLRDFTFTFHFHALEKEMEPTPVFLPGESQGQESLVGCRLWGRTELDTTEATWQQQWYSQDYIGGSISSRYHLYQARE